MFLSDDTYLKKLEAQLANARRASIAVAFWGKGAEKVFAHWKGDSLRIICNLAMGGTNPEAIKALSKLKNVEIQQLDNLHAKVAITEHAVLIGSANVSANGLGFEGGECTRWHEAGLLSDAVDHMQAARVWFDALWSRAYQVKDIDLEDARIKWQSRRNVRPSSDRNQSLLEQPLDALTDRAIYLVIYRDKASPEGLSAFSRGVQDLVEGKQISEPPKKLDFFENWPAKSPLPDNPRATLIEVYFSRRGKVNVKDLFSPLPGVRVKFKYSSGEKGILDLVIKRDKIEGWTLSRQDRLKLANELQPWLNTFEWGEQSDRCIPFHDFKVWQASLASGCNATLNR